jgi:integrase
MSSIPRPKLHWIRVESGIRKRPNDDGSTVYEVRVRRKGAPERTLTSPTLREARKQRDMARSQAWEGKHTQGAEGKRKTVSELCEAFLKARYGDHTDRSHYRTHKGHLQWWCERIGEYRLAQITPQSLLKYREELLQSVTPTTCQRYFASLSGAFTWAIKDERQWVACNPVRLVTKPRDPRPQEERERVRFLSTDERTRLFAACAQSHSLWLSQIVLMALVTGARKSEILTLRWRDIDVQAGMVCFRNTKNGSDCTITLVDPVLTFLRERHQGSVIPHPGSYVFPAPCRTKPLDIRTAWETAVRKAALKDFHFHDLRHTTASYLRIDGHSLEDIGDLLGHRSLIVTRRYAHLDDSYQQKMLGSTMGKVFGEGGRA